MTLPKLSSEVFPGIRMKLKISNNKGIIADNRAYCSHLEAVVQRCSAKKDVLRNFAKLTGKDLCQSLNFIKKETLEQVFSCEFFEISKTNFS